MKGDLKTSEIIGILVALVIIVLVISVFIKPPISAANPLNSTISFFDICIFWAADDWRSTRVYDNNNVAHDLLPYCESILGVKKAAWPPTREDDFWEACKKQCPGY